MVVNDIKKKNFLFAIILSYKAFVINKYIDKICKKVYNKYIFLLYNRKEMFV